MMLFEQHCLFFLPCLCHLQRIPVHLYHVALFDKAPLVFSWSFSEKNCAIFPFHCQLFFEILTPYIVIDVTSQLDCKFVFQLSSVKIKLLNFGDGAVIHHTLGFNSESW